VLNQPSLTPSQPLEPEEVSQAWSYLSNLPLDQLLDPFLQLDPPSNLRKLSQADWYLLDRILAREMYLKSRSPVQ